jgi:hypothetical protein
MPFVQDSPPRGVEVVAFGDPLHRALYAEFRREREPLTSVVEGCWTVGVPNCPTDLVECLFAQVVRHAGPVEGPACRVSLTLSLHSVEHEEGKDERRCCQATEFYDDGMVIKSISEEGEVERCSVPCPDSRPVENEEKTHEEVKSSVDELIEMLEAEFPLARGSSSGSFDPIPPR